MFILYKLILFTYLSIIVFLISVYFALILVIIIGWLVHKYLYPQFEELYCNNLIGKFLTKHGIRRNYKEEEYIKEVMPTNHYNRIYYFLDPLGTLILLKGNFNELPMREIQKYFDIEILSMNKFALIEKNRDVQKARIFAYLEEAAHNI